MKQKVGGGNNDLKTLRRHSEALSKPNRIPSEYRYQNSRVWTEETGQ